MRWSGPEKIAFRFFFLYFFLQAVPLDWKYYRNLFSINWLDLHLGDILNLSRYTPQFFAGNPTAGSWGLNTFADWGVVFAIAVVGAIIWTIRDKDRREYNQLYYWLRVILRYRLAAGLLAYAFIKIYPMQAPLPSISHLNTYYGDFTAWKLFSLTLGIVPDYQSFLGLVELLAAVLLLFRKTTSIGAFLVLPFTGNVFMSNLAYEGGEYVYSFYLVTIALFLFFFDAKRLFSLLMLEQPTLPNLFKPFFRDWQKTARVVLKPAFVFLFVVLYGYKAHAVYNQEGSYHYPKTAGLPGVSGLYNVKEFRLNQKILPYSATDVIRWQDVVFEKWATISVRSNRPVLLETAKTEEIIRPTAARNFELAEAGGRHYYDYQLDAANQVLTLQNKNKNYPNKKLVLQYQQPTANQIILSGLNEQQDSVYIVLEKQPKKYLLEEAAGRGRREALKL
ncbi:DoxX family protein [Adhaeribacter rhizoryzae]|uniref:DoxX family protein n=1 Tax=Adhaeribacter rhizoryzae TaxID=2607907 RepID=A0A5M6D6P6_9BACT|nr:DoxX family protein [Adhaeribacter rhizoryzae]